MGKKVIDFMCTAFRDGFQSCYGARVLNKDFLPAMEACKEAGIKWFEHGGGAIFQSKVFYCNENPFTAMDEIRTMGFSQEDLNNVMEQNRQELNKQLPVYSKLQAFELQKEEFQKTPKKSIKRYLYQ